MDYQDYYKSLGVDKNADEKEIKQAFRKLARKYQPDATGGDKEAETQFKRINEAYEVLSDADKRAKYDQLGSNYQHWQRSGGAASGFNWGDFNQGYGTNTGGFRTDYNTEGPDFSEFFSSFFGGNARTREPYNKQPIRGNNVEQPLEITLEEAYRGTERILNRGGKKKTVRIPPGAREGTRVRVAGEGEGGFAGGARGDLMLVVQIKPHPVFERQGDDDLSMDLKVGVYTAVLGGEIVVHTLAGDVKVRIPAGTPSGKRIRLANRGMPHLNQPDVKGDLYVRVQVQVPTSLSDEERSLFEQLAALRPDSA